MSGALGRVVVGRYGSRMEAEIARGLLSAHGFDAVVRADDAGGLHPELGASYGVVVAVPPEDADDALELLRTPPDPGPAATTA